MIRNEVWFGGKSSVSDFGLTRVETTIDGPKAKTISVDVDGMDGVLDFTEYFGEVLYENRTMSLSFETAELERGYAALYADICNALDGRRMNITLSEDADYYWAGRVAVGEFKVEKGIGQLDIDVDCEPYRYRKNITTVNTVVSGSKQLALSNLRKRVRPTVDATGAVTITMAGKSFSVPKGTGWTDPKFLLSAGQNALNITGNGTVTFKYQERGL